MAVATSHHTRSGADIRSPIRDETYDLLQALAHKCEAIETYAKYEEDASDENRALFQELAKDEAKHAERLLEALKQQIR